MFEEALEEARRKYGLLVFGYVVMPEHVHFLVSEPERELLSTAISAIKQSVARRLIGEREPCPTHSKRRNVWVSQGMHYDVTDLSDETV